MAEMLPQVLAQLGLAGVQPAQIAAAVAFVGYLMFYSSWSTLCLVGALVAAAFFSHRPAFAAAGGGLRGGIAMAKAATSSLASKTSAVSGRHVSNVQVLYALAVAVVAVSYLVPSAGRVGRTRAGSTRAAAGDSLDELELAVKAAYDAGFEDGAAGRKRDSYRYLATAALPVFPESPPASLGSSGQKLGVGSFINMVYLYMCYARMHARTRRAWLGCPLRVPR
jgi:hypothetical protein